MPTLRRSLEDIEKHSQALLGKGKAARILDKTQDSGKVVKLIEQLRQAILVYQVGQLKTTDRDQFKLTFLGQLSQQRSIDNRVTKLAVSLLPSCSPSELTPR